MSEFLTVGSAGEDVVIALARRAADLYAAHRPSVVLHGIGDDTAVLAPEPGQRLLVSQDMLVEDVHFRRDWSSPEWVGRKAVSVNVSDIAAMGGQPSALLSSVAFPPDLPLSWVERFFNGFAQAADDYGAALVGGDTVASPGPVVLDVTVLGAVDRPSFRHGAEPGDAILVTGTLGLAHAGWRLLEAGSRWPGTSEAERAALERQLTPTARVAAGRILGAAAHALTDISDGLWRELSELTGQGVGAVVNAWELPTSPALRTLGGKRALFWALSGGEDYELLAVVPPSRVEEVRRRLEAVRVPVSVVGAVDDGLGVRVRWCAGEEPTSWSPEAGDSFQHFGGGEARNG